MSTINNHHIPRSSCRYDRSPCPPPILPPCHPGLRPARRGDGDTERMGKGGEPAGRGLGGGTPREPEVTEGDGRRQAKESGKVTRCQDSS